MLKNMLKYNYGLIGRVIDLFTRSEFKGAALNDPKIK